MKTEEVIKLFEPKLPPINLYCISPAWWYYRNTTTNNPTPEVVYDPLWVDHWRIKELIMAHNGY